MSNTKMGAQVSNEEMVPAENPVNLDKQGKIKKKNGKTKSAKVKKSGSDKSVGDKVESKSNSSAEISSGKTENAVTKDVDKTRHSSGEKNKKLDPLNAKTSQNKNGAIKKINIKDEGKEVCIESEENDKEKVKLDESKISIEENLFVKTEENVDEINKSKENIGKIENVCQEESLEKEKLQELQINLSEDTLNFKTGDNKEIIEEFKHSNKEIDESVEENIENVLKDANLEKEKLQESTTDFSEEILNLKKPENKEIEGLNSCVEIKESDLSGDNLKTEEINEEINNSVEEIKETVNENENLYTEEKENETVEHQTDLPEDSVRTENNQEINDEESKEEINVNIVKILPEEKEKLQESETDFEENINMKSENKQENIEEIIQSDVEIKENVKDNVNKLSEGNNSDLKQTDEKQIDETPENIQNEKENNLIENKKKLEKSITEPSAENFSLTLIKKGDTSVDNSEKDLSDISNNIENSAKIDDEDKISENSNNIDISDDEISSEELEDYENLEKVLDEETFDKSDNNPDNETIKDNKDIYENVSHENNQIIIANETIKNKEFISQENKIELDHDLSNDSLDINEDKKNIESMSENMKSEEITEDTKDVDKINVITELEEQIDGPKTDTEIQEDILKDFSDHPNASDETDFVKQDIESIDLIETSKSDPENISKEVEEINHSDQNLINTEDDEQIKISDSNVRKENGEKGQETTEEIESAVTENFNNCEINQENKNAAESNSYSKENMEETLDDNIVYKEVNKKEYGLTESQPRLDTDKEINNKQLDNLEDSREVQEIQENIVKPYSDSAISEQLESSNQSSFEPNPDYLNNNEEMTDLENDAIMKRRISRKSICQFVHEEEDSEERVTEYLDKCNNQAEARLAARRQARAEAREIRMRELERQQKEQEENADRQYDMLAEPITRTARTAITARETTRLNNSSYLSSRRSSEDSLEDGGSLRDVRHELKELEEKFRKAMVANAQLDNEKSAQTYQLELLKDRIEELEEELSQLRREHRETCRENDQMKRLTTRLKEEFTACKTELEERDRLIMEKGLVIVGEIVPEDDGGGDPSTVRTPKKALVSIENAELLENAGEGSLDVRLKKFAEEKRELMDQLSHLRLELEEERSRKKRRTSTITANASLQNGPSLESDTLDVIDIQREANKQLADYKFRLQKSEQDIATLQATVARLESQVIRYKSAAEASEKAEDELKVEKRKLQREVKESQSRIEELETTNNHLQRRLEKVKNAKSALLKEL